MSRTGEIQLSVISVLQTEHNLVIRMQAFPLGMNLRLVADGQRLLSSDLAQVAGTHDQGLAQIDGWNDRSHPFVWTKTADQILAKANRPTTSNPRH